MTLPTYSQSTLLASHRESFRHRSFMFLSFLHLVQESAWGFCLATSSVPGITGHTVISTVSPVISSSILCTPTPQVMADHNQFTTALPSKLDRCCYHPCNYAQLCSNCQEPHPVSACKSGKALPSKQPRNGSSPPRKI